MLERNQKKLQEQKRTMAFGTCRFDTRSAGRHCSEIQSARANEAAHDVQNGTSLKTDSNTRSRTATKMHHVKNQGRERKQQHRDQPCERNGVVDKYETVKWKRGSVTQRRVRENIGKNNLDTHRKCDMNVATSWEILTASRCQVHAGWRVPGQVVACVH